MFFAMILLYFFIGETIADSEGHTDNYSSKIYDRQWSLLHSDGTRENVNLPYNFHTPKGKTLTLETTLPEIENDHSSIAFRGSRQDMKIYINNSLVTSYTTKNTRLFGTTSPSIYVFCNLAPKDSGKKLRIECRTTSTFSGMFYPAYYGSDIGIWANLIQKNVWELIIALIMLIIGVASSIGGILYTKSMGDPIPLQHIGWASVLAAIWVVTNSSLRQLIFPNVSVAGDIPFLVMMLLPIPLSLYMDCLQGRRYHKFYHIIMGISIVDFSVCFLLHITDTIELAKTAFGMESVLILFVLVATITIIIDLITNKIQEYTLSAIGLVLAMFAGLMQLIMYIVKSFSFNGMMMCLALLFIMLTSAINAFRDVGRKEIERREAIHASESKAQFLANISHEIRTPINAVLGMDEMILRESTDANIREYATDLQHAGQSLLALINDILDYSKLESNNMEIINVDYDIASLINDSYNMVSMRAKDKNLELRVLHDNYLPSRLNGDEIRLRQIILNLLTNAIKYTKEGSVTFKVGGEKLSDDLFLLRISVKDTGIGIKKEDLPQIFGSFQRVEESRNRNIEGTGLGLSITRYLIELMDGNIYVDSEYGSGSTFTFEVKQQIVNSESMNDVHIQYAQHNSLNEVFQQSFIAPDARILVVDDVAVNLKVVQGLLKTSQIHISTANSGIECLNLVEKEHFDIIFLDHMMPKMDGIETFKHMKALRDNPNKDTPVIMLTANALSGSKEEYLSIGFADYLAKPIQISALDELLLRYLPKHLVTNLSVSTTKASASETFMEQLNHLLDADVGLDYYDGNEDFYREILEAYVEDGDVSMLNNLFESADWQNYQVSIHSVKSSSIYIGATRLADEALKLEMAAKENRINYITEHHASVMHMYQDLINRLAYILENTK
jgi:signal transduction histidine kinase/CheY-like chemotaxis protein